MIIIIGGRGRMSDKVGGSWSPQEAIAWACFWSVSGRDIRGGGWEVGAEEEENSVRAKDRTWVEAKRQEDALSVQGTPSRSSWLEHTPSECGGEWGEMGQGRRGEEGLRTEDMYTQLESSNTALKASRILEWPLWCPKSSFKENCF